MFDRYFFKAMAKNTLVLTLAFFMTLLAHLCETCTFFARGFHFCRLSCFLL